MHSFRHLRLRPQALEGAGHGGKAHEAPAPGARGARNAGGGGRHAGAEYERLGSCWGAGYARYDQRGTECNTGYIGASADDYYDDTGADSYDHRASDSDHDYCGSEYSADEYCGSDHGANRGSDNDADDDHCSDADDCDSDTDDCGADSRPGGDGA